MIKRKWLIQRPAGGITLNAGHPEVLRSGKRVLQFDTRRQAVQFLIMHSIIRSEADLADSTIEIVKEGANAHHRKV